MSLQLLRVFSQICQIFNQNGHVSQIELLEKPSILILRFANLQNLSCYFVNLPNWLFPLPNQLYQIAKSIVPNC
jgi:hypothetical protein